MKRTDHRRPRSRAAARVAILDAIPNRAVVGLAIGCSIALPFACAGDDSADMPVNTMPQASVPAPSSSAIGPSTPSSGASVTPVSPSTQSPMPSTSSPAPSQPATVSPATTPSNEPIAPAPSTAAPTNVPQPTNTGPTPSPSVSPQPDEPTPVDPQPSMPEPVEAPDSGVNPQPTPNPGNTICPASPGSPPSGQLSATHIESVTVSDNNFHLFEGAAWVEGALYFSDIAPSGGAWNSTIRRFDPSTGMTTDFLVGAGSNGLAVDSNGVLHSATSAKKEISKYDLSSAMQQSVVTGMFNSPNDLAIASDGTIYFSDPQQGEIPAGNQPQVVHVVKGGVDAVLTDEIQGPNGVTLSPSEDVLYVAGGGFFVKRVHLVDGLAGEIEDLVTGLQTPDGMTKDCAGNLYIAEHNAARILVVNPEGEQLATIALGSAGNQNASPTNVAFGGADGKTLYITAIYSLWQIQLDIAGYPY